MPSDSSPELLSKSAFAVRCGVSAAAVSNWLARGKLDPASCLTENGQIIVLEAERQLAITVDPGRAAGAVEAAETRRTAPLPRTAPLREAAEPISAREESLRLDVEMRRRRLREQDGTLLRADQVRVERGRALVQMIAAIDNWTQELAGELALDPERQARLLASWRRFRARQAEQMLAEAEALPALLSDAA